MNAIKTVLFVMTLIIANTANALCVNTDGSLDDKSMSPETVAVEMLPQCEAKKLVLEADKAKATNKSHVVSVKSYVIPYLFGDDE